MDKFITKRNRESNQNINDTESTSGRSSDDVTRHHTSHTKENISSKIRKNNRQYSEEY